MMFAKRAIQAPRMDSSPDVWWLQEQDGSSFVCVGTLVRKHTNDADRLTSLQITTPDHRVGRRFMSFEISDK